MFTTIEQFKNIWQQESGNTRKVFASLTDDSLNKQVADKHRTLGRMAWHIVQTLPEMAGLTGLKVVGPDAKEPVPTSAAQIKDAYDKAAASLLDQVVNNWQDDTLKIEDEMYGQKWSRGVSLFGVISHEIHHRGQMTVLMRQAGLPVAGVYGPSLEEWSQYGMNAPEI
jgi:uncharacterized damage-inducible protein DinB